ncbi:CaiB/BaiF CoA transferase family protein [Variovorax sp. DAIF25]|uniref:CaiB/BaiF CoA transferase family protein n=1 Tax=Variovorax sp. DAIF25 TaxID=3080983 RepID=UPI003D6A40C1
MKPSSASRSAADVASDGGKTGPLRGLRVLDISTIVAAPTAAALLGDYGAQVTKIELPGSGDGLRNFAPFKEGRSLWWKATNRDKRLLTLDLRHPRARPIFSALLAETDVLIENFRPGTLDGWGWSRDALWQAQPRLVILRATAFGQDGPYAARPGFARVFEAMGGLAYITGSPEGPPMHAGYPIGDAIGGLFGALGVMAALWKRARAPDLLGEDIDLSLTEGVLKLLDFLTLKQELLGESHERSGNLSQYAAPGGVYRSRDGQWVSLSGSTDAIFAANCKAIGREDLAANARYATNRHRCESAAVLNAVFGDWFALHDLDEIVRLFERAGGTLAPVYSARQIAEDPQMRARGFLQAVEDPDHGRVHLPGVVPRFALDPCAIRRTAGGLGVDNAEVYGGLGLAPAELESLARQRVI